MILSTLLMFHISNAVIALISGALSMLFRKGSGLHQVAGNSFFISMMGMSGAGVCIATFFRPNAGNLMGGSLAFYLVATAWKAGRRREHKIELFDWIFLAAALTVAAAGLFWASLAANGHSHLTEHYPAPFFVVFSTIFLLFAFSDIRMIVHGGVSGPKRIARHLLRMCLAMLLTTFSFFPGQAKLFSPELRRMAILYVPHYLIIGSMIYWMVRVRARKRLPRAQSWISSRRAVSASTRVSSTA